MRADPVREHMVVRHVLAPPLLMVTRPTPQRVVKSCPLLVCLGLTKYKRGTMVTRKERMHQVANLCWPNQGGVETVMVMGSSN